MSIALNTKNTIAEIPLGKVFNYRFFEQFEESPEAVIKTVNRLVDDGTIKRLSRGKFYKPEKGYLGALQPSDSELLNTVLYKNGRLRGYITGAALYNTLGLTTQLPKTITLAINGSRQTKDFGTIKVVTKPTSAPVDEKSVELLQYLDVLTSASKIMDGEINETLAIMSERIAELTASQQKKIIELAIRYYGAKAKATLGLLLTSLGLSIPVALEQATNPVTSYKLGVDQVMWPNAKQWNIS